MQKSLSHFIEQIHRYPDHILEDQLKALLENKTIKALKDHGYLKRGSDLKELLCQSCDDDHFVPIRVEGEKLYYLCPQQDTARNYVSLDAVSTWHFNTGAFLQQLSLKLKIEDSIEKMKIHGLWQIGSFSKDDTRHNCYYYQGRDFDQVLAFIKQLPSTMRRYVIFTNKQELSKLESEHELLSIEVKELITLKNNKITFNKGLFDEFLINGFRSIIFNPKNGDLIANGQIIANIKPSTAEYNFIEILWQNFNEPVSHQRIQGYVYKKTGKEYEDDPQKLSHKQKKKVKDKSNNPTLIDEIFKSTSDLDGNNSYVMKNL
ncbi:hypothetical protein JKY72_04260 [Candidatus Gracilibacteria bacterium]|nr:hypothetical protein [Candidatus Gracilibacteria bacterium]